MANTEWKSALCYSDEEAFCVRHEINGKEQKFYPVSVHLLFQLRGATSKAARAISDLMADTSRDYKIHDMKSAKGGETESVYQVDPKSLEVMKYRDAQRAEAWAGIVGALTDTDTQNTLAAVIMDSLHEVFANGKPTPEEFLKNTKGPAFAQMLWGAFKANKDVFGPLAEKAGSLFKQLEGKVPFNLPESADGLPKTNE